MPASPVRKLVPYAIQAKQKGIKVYHLNIGEPDIETPETALNAVKKHRPQSFGICFIREGKYRVQKSFDRNITTLLDLRFNYLIISS